MACATFEKHDSDDFIMGKESVRLKGKLLGERVNTWKIYGKL